MTLPDPFPPAPPVPGPTPEPGPPPVPEPEPVHGGHPVDPRPGAIAHPPARAGEEPT